MRSLALLLSCAAGGLLVALYACAQPEATAEAPDGGTDGTTSDAGADSEAAAPRAATMATLTSLVARSVGHAGADLQVVVQGDDPTLTAYAAHIRVRDAEGNRVLAFEGNWNGPGPGVFGEKAAERRVVFDPTDVPGERLFTHTVTLPGILAAFPEIARIDFAVLTAGDRHSIKHFAEVAPQPVKSSAQPCDPSLQADRCAPGLGCIGTPAACAKPEPPAFARLLYVPGPDGPHLLFEASDPAGQLKGARIDFLKVNEEPQTVDMGNGQFVTYEELTFASATSYGRFFVDHVAPLGFESTVPRLAATPSGADGGARTIARFGPPPQKPAGQACEARGFIGCAAGHSCIRDGATGTEVCVATTEARARTATAAATLDVSTGRTFATGHARGVSLWDPPAECLAASALGRPEGLVRLHLAAPMASLTISTAVEETNFDTALYLLPGAGDSEDSPLGCNDDATGSASTLTVENLPAGDYTIVVDSKSMTGGRFGVKLQ